MKVILSMAMSVNGIIADKHGSEDFLSHHNWVAFVKLANKIGSNIWGRKTYEAVKTWEGDYLNELESVKKIVLSSDSALALSPEFTLATSPQDALAKLEDEGKREALVTGGPTINSEFIKAGLVDEVIFTVEPILMGQGMPVFAPTDFELRLKLLSIDHLTPNYIALYYKVIK